jgi:AbrB family looped-hinge helix DNA binding protein
MPFLKHRNRDKREEPAMPLVKVIRNGQITLPKALRDVLGIKEGDLLEVKLRNSEMTIKPKAAIDKAMAGDRFFQMVDEIRASVQDVDPEELEATIAEAVQAAKKVTAKRNKARPRQ